MPYNMYDIGPARYHAMQGQQRGDKFRQMMNMLMMMQQMKQRQGQFEAGQEQMQQRWEAEGPLRQAREQYYQAQAQPKVPAPFQLYQILVQNGWKPKDAEKIAFKVKPEEVPDWLQKAQYLVHAEPDKFPNLGSAIMWTLRGEAKDKLDRWQETRLDKEKKTAFEEMIDKGLGTIADKITKAEERKLDPATQQYTEPDPTVIKNLRSVEDLFRNISAKAGAGDATEEHKKLFYTVYGQLNRAMKEGAFWKKDEFGYVIGEKKTAKGAVWEYMGNNQWRKMK